jgi:hypothetical protein
VQPASGTRESLDPLELALEWIDLLAGEVGPRPPTGRGERLARLLMREELRRGDVESRIEPFDGYRSFALPFGLIEAAAVLPSLLPARARRLRSAVALGAGTALLGEGSLRWTPLSRALSRRPSGNLVATIEPAGEVERTLCLSAHLDSSRSGLIFHPRLVGALGHWISAQSVATLAQAALEPLAGGSRTGRRALAGLRLLIAAGLALLAERELRGEDVAGANDNASGAAVAAALACEVASERLRGTRLVLLLTGCEEAGTLGAQAFLEGHDTGGWLFLNFDNVGGGGTLRYLRREGVLAKWDADPALTAAAAAIAEQRPDLRMAAEDSPAGLTYDSSPVLARGGRAMTLSIQDGRIPDLHWPTDVPERVDHDGVARTLEAGRELIAAVDRGLPPGGPDRG